MLVNLDLEVPDIFDKISRFKFLSELSVYTEKGDYIKTKKVCDKWVKRYREQKEEMEKYYEDYDEDEIEQSRYI